MGLKGNVTPLFPPECTRCRTRDCFLPAC